MIVSSKATIASSEHTRARVGGPTAAAEGLTTSTHDFAHHEEIAQYEHTSSIDSGCCTIYGGQFQRERGREFAPDELCWYTLNGSRVCSPKSLVEERKGDKEVEHVSVGYQGLEKTILDTLKVASRICTSMKYCCGIVVSSAWKP